MTVFPIKQQYFYKHIVNILCSYHYRVFAAVVFTALSIGRAGSFAGDATKAQTSAARITSLLKRKPRIDVTSDEGIKLVSSLYLPPYHCVLM